MSLRNLNPDETYRKFKASLATDFYGPCLLNSRRYSRAVGYFSSSIYTIAWPALKVFVANAGKMRLICSPFLREDDAAAMEEGHLNRAQMEVNMLKVVSEWLADPLRLKPAKVVGALIAHGVLDVKVATAIPPGSPMRRTLFHDKLGIFEENVSDDFVIFKGSMNETGSGLSDDGNLESIDVSVSWDPARDGKRARDEREAFEQMWHGTFPGVEVQDFPDAPKRILTKAAEGEDWETLVDEIENEQEGAFLGGREPFEHQRRAVSRWDAAGSRGILRHATGSGKTFTSMLTIKQALEQSRCSLVLVPSSLLLQQWQRELQEAFPHARMLVAGDGFNGWRRPGILEAQLRANAPSIILSTMQTACSDGFRRRLHRFPDVHVVADEVHRMGSQEHQRIMEGWEPSSRLGLSATPERHGDPDGTKRLFDWFGPVVDEYDIQDAIRDGRLTRYWYSPYVVDLTVDEAKDYADLSKQIAQLYAQIHGGGEPGQHLEQRLRAKLLARAKIIKQASGKIPCAIEILRKEYNPGQHWLVYCDNQIQMQELRANLERAGIQCDEYHSQMEGDKKQTLRYFAARGGILLSIKCLDEGVDIPIVSHALILASSKNPREYIQRRGRVLRKFKGKHLAYIFDTIVVPPIPEPDDPPSSVEAEIERSIEFGGHATNRGCVRDLQGLAAKYGADQVVSRYLSGVEDDDENQI